MIFLSPCEMWRGDCWCWKDKLCCCETTNKEYRTPSAKLNRMDILPQRMAYIWVSTERTIVLLCEYLERLDQVFAEATMTKTKV